MKISIKRTKYTTLETMFILLWTFYSVYYFLLSASEISYDYYSFASSARRFCSYALLIFLFVFWLVAVYRVANWNIGMLIRYLAFLAVILLIELNDRDTTLMILVLFVMAAQFMDFDKLLRYDIKLKLVMLIVIFALCALGIVQNRVGDYYSGYKQALGFNHANTMVCYVITILVEWLCIRYKKMKWYEWGGIIITFFILLYFSASRTSLYTFIIIFALFVLANIVPKLFTSKVVKTAFIAITPIMVFISFWAVRLYGQGNSIIQALNSWLSGRIRLAYCAVTVKGVKLFGQDIQFSSRFRPADNRTIFLVDNAYIHLALQWGAVILLLMIIAYSILFIKLINAGKINVALMALFFVILGFGETYMNNVLYNISILCLLGTPIVRRNISDKEEVEVT